MADAPKYQLLPDLTAEEYAALRDDIAEHGYDPAHPVVVDEDGNTLDGHHREAVCRELGITPPTVTRGGLTEAEKVEYALGANLRRRHLTQEQKRDLVRAELQRDPDRSDRAIGRLVGVSHPTVAAVRRELVVNLSTDDALAQTELVRGLLHRTDNEIVARLLCGVSPAWMAASLLTEQFKFEEACAGKGEEFLGSVREHIFESRIDAVLAWPDSGWYADDVASVHDELYAMLEKQRAAR